MFGILLVLTILSSALAAGRIPHQNYNFEEFKAEYGKVYAHGQEEKHYLAFIDNVNLINEHNAEYEEGKHTYWLGVNQYTDYTEEEFKSILGFRAPEKDSLQFIRKGDPIGTPDKVDWRDKGAVTPVKNQGHCGSCWAFSAVSAIEGQWFINKGQLTDTAEQQLVSCDKHSEGCNGGYPTGCYSYIHDNGANGIDTTASYPYTARDDPCDSNKTSDGQNVAATVSGGAGVDASEGACQEALANVGPMSICLGISSKFQQYSGGIFDDPECVSIGGHCVSLVGYDTAENVWYLRNSWGTGWGESGYMRVVKGKDVCGMLSHINYPTL